MKESKGPHYILYINGHAYSPDTEIPTLLAHEPRHLRLVPVRHCEAPEIVCDAPAEVEHEGVPAG